MKQSGEWKVVSKVFFVAQMMFVATCLSEVECPERDIHRRQSH